MYLGQAVKPVLLDCTFHQQERALENKILSIANIEKDNSPGKSGNRIKLGAPAFFLNSNTRTAPTKVLEPLLNLTIKATFHKTGNKLVAGHDKLVTKRDAGDRRVPAQLGMGVRMPSAHVIPASRQSSFREAKMTTHPCL